MDDARYIPGQRLAAQGAPLAATPFIIARGGSYWTGTAAVAWDGTKRIGLAE